MANDFNIVLSARLDEALSTKNLQVQLDNIAKNLSLKLSNIGLDSNLTNVLKELTNSLNSIKTISDQSNRVLSTQVTITKEIDGTIRKIEESKFADGSIWVKSTENLTKQNQELQKNINLQRQLASEIDNVGKAQKQVTTQNGYGEITGNSTVYKNGNTSTTVNSDAEGYITSTKTVENLQRAETETQKYAQTLDTLQQKLLGFKQVGLLSDTQISNFSNMIDSSKTLTDLKAVEQEYTRLNTIQKELLDVETARYKVEQQENQQTAKLQAENTEIQRQIELYRQQADIKINGLNTSNVSGYVDQSALSDWQASIQNLSANSLSDLHKLLQQINTDLDTIKSNAKVAFDSAQVQQENAQLQREIELFQQLKTSQLNSFSSSNLGEFANTSSVSNIKNLIGELSNVSSMDEFKQKVQQINTEFTTMSNNAKTAKNEVNPLFGDMKNAVSSLLPYFGAGGLAIGLTSFFRDGIQYVTDFNKQLTLLSTTVNYTQQQVDQLGKSYIQLGSQLGVQSQDVASSAVEFYRQGLGGQDQEVNNRVQLATEFAKISGLDYQQAAQVMVAANQSMGVSNQKVVDTFTLLGDSASTSAAEIGAAFQKVGGTAGSLGVNFDKVASWITEISDRTRESADTVGSSVKSIMARVDSLKQKGYDSTDGTTVNQVSSALSTAGIQLIDSQTGQFRNFGTVMDELGAKWETLDSRQKNFIATSVAGTFQMSRFLSLMNNYNDSIRLYNLATNSAGTAQQKMDLYLQGTEAHVNKMKDALQNLWSDMFNSDSIKNATDSITALINTIDGLYNSLGGMSGVVGIAATALLLFTSRGKELVSTITNFPAILTQFKVAMGTATLEEQAMANATNEASVATKGLGLSLDTVFRSTVVGLAITGIVALIGNLASQQEQYNETLAQYQQKQQEVAQAFATNGAQIENLVSQYENLSAKTNLSTDEHTQLDNVTKQLAQMFPDLIDYVDQEGNAHLKNADAINKEVAAQKEALKVKAQLDAQTFQSDYKKNTDKYNQDQAQIDKLQKQIDAELEMDNAQTKNGGSLAFSGDPQQIDTWKAQLEALRADQQQLASENSTGIKQQSDAVAELTDGYDNLDNTMRRALADYENKLKPTDVTANGLAQTPTKYIQTLVSISKQLQDAQANPDMTFDDKSKLMDQLSQSAKDAGISMDLLNQEFLQYLHMSQSGSQSSYDFGSAITDLQKQYSDQIKNVGDLNNAINTLNKGQLLSQSTIDSLVTKYPALTSQITMRNGQETLTTKALMDQRDTENANFQMTLDNTQKEIVAQEQALQARLKIYDIDLSNIKTVSDAQAAQVQMMEKAAELYNHNTNGKTYYGAPNVADPQFVADQKALMDILNLNQTIQGMQDGLKQGLNFDTSATSASGATQQLTQLEQAINDVDSAYQELQNQMQQYPNHSEQYRNAIQQEIDLLTQKKQLLQEQIANPLTGFTLPNAVQNLAGGTSDTSGQVGQSPFASSAKLGYTGQYSDVISSAASKYGIDPNLLAAVLYQESGINPLDENGNTKVSNAGAIGIAQFIPDTAKRYKVDPYDTTSSINGSAHFLSDLLTEFNGNLKLALAGYNAGDKAAQYALSSNDPKYKQTRDYVPAVLAHYQQFSGGQVPQDTSANNIDQAKAVADAVKKAQTTLAQTNSDIWKAQKALVDDMLGQYEDEVGQYQSYAKTAQSKMQDMHKGSSDYNGMLDSQYRSLNEQKYIAEQEVSYINSTQFKDYPEYQKKVADLTASLADYDAQMQKIKQDKLDNNLTPLTQENTIIDDTIKKLEQQNQLYKDKNTANVYDPAYITNLNTEITLQNQKVQILEQQNQMIEAQGTLSDANLQTIAQNNQAIADANSAMEQEKLTVANEVVAAMKNGIQEEINAENERHTAFMNNLNEESKAYENQINNQIKQLQDQKSANDYNDQLTTEQKARQKIVDQINALSMDTSVDAKSKRADLQQQLADEDQKILKLQTDREYTVRQQNLQDQLTAYKQDVQNKTDAENDKYNSTKNSLQNQLNDTQHWDQVTKDILDGNVSGIQDEMKQLITGLESYSNTSTNTVDGYFNHVLQRAQEVTTAMNQLTDIANTNNPTSNPIASAQAQVAAYQQAWQTAFNNKQFDQATLAHIKAVEVASQNGGIYNSATGAYNWVNPNSLTVDQVKQIIQQLGDAWKVASAQDQATLHQIANQLGASHGGQYNSATGTWTFPSSIAQMATGAELPLWGSEGKVGILHEGEIVQTKDTAQDFKTVASSAKDFKSIAAKFGNLNISDLASKINLDAMKQSMLPTVSAPNMSGVMSMVNNINNKDGDTHIHLENVTFQGVQDVENGADRLVGRLTSQFRKNGGQFRTR